MRLQTVPNRTLALDALHQLVVVHPLHPRLHLDLGLEVPLVWETLCQLLVMRHGQVSWHPTVLKPVSLGRLLVEVLLQMLGVVVGLQVGNQPLAVVVGNLVVPPSLGCDSRWDLDLGFVLGRRLVADSGFDFGLAVLFGPTHRHLGFSGLAEMMTVELPVVRLH